MKILYLAFKYDYGRPEKGLSFEHYNFYDSFLKMNGGENKIIYFPVDEMIHQGLDSEKIKSNFLKIINEEKPNFLFFWAGGGIITKEIIGEISKRGEVVTLSWMPDDHWQFHKSSKQCPPHFNFIATTDSQAPAKYNKIGYKNIIKSQWACNHFLYKPLSLPKIYDVTFVGAAHSNRKKIVQKIKAAGVNIKCWGSGWPAGRVSQDEMIRIFSQSKVNLNFTKSSGVLWKELALIFLSRNFDRSIKLNSPKKWVNNLRAFFPSMRSRQVKGRIFEIPGCKGFLLTEYADNLEDYYQDEKDIVWFKNVKELIEKIEYYLNHEKEREAIAKAGYERTLEEHTYENRFNEIFKIMDFKK